MFGTVVAVFLMLATLQADRTWTHAFVVAGIAGAISFFVPSVLLFGAPLPSGVDTALPLATGIAIGTPMGIAARRRRDRDDAVAAVW